VEVISLEPCPSRAWIVLAADVAARVANLLGETSLEDQFRAHIHRGVILLAGRMKTLAELGEQFSVRTA